MNNDYKYMNGLACVTGADIMLQTKHALLCKLLQSICVSLCFFPSICKSFSRGWNGRTSQTHSDTFSSYEADNNMRTEARRLFAVDEKGIMSWHRLLAERYDKAIQFVRTLVECFSVCFCLHIPITVIPTYPLP